MERKSRDAHLFFRDPALPFLEARSVDDGRHVCYDRHAHATFSIGAITGGQSLYWNQGASGHVGRGAVVLMNPEAVHACNPIDNEPWSYRMFYVDTAWLGALQPATEGDDGDAFRPVATTVSTDPQLYRALNRLFDTLVDIDGDALSRHSAAVAFFSDLYGHLERVPTGAVAVSNRKLERAAEFIDAHCTGAPRLEDICAAVGLSPSYLVRAFKRRYGMTPHAWLIDRRIRFAQHELKLGRPIAEVALDAGFADQAHFQRLFKRHVAATPRQYTAPYPGAALQQEHHAGGN